MWRSKGGDQHPGDRCQKDPIEKPLPKRAPSPPRKKTVSFITNAIAPRGFAMYDTDVSMQSSRRFPMVLHHAIIFILLGGLSS